MFENKPEVTLTRLFTGEDGESHFDVLRFSLKDAGAIGHLSEMIQTEGVILRHNDGDYDYRWHNAPCRQLVVMLAGEVDIEVGSGEVRRFGPGDLLLAEDVHGQGHCSRAVAGQPRRSLFIPLGGQELS